MVYISPEAGFFTSKGKRIEDEPTMWMKMKEIEMQEDIKAAVDNLNEFLLEFEALGGRLTISHDHRAKAQLQFKVEFDD